MKMLDVPVEKAIKGEETLDNVEAKEEILSKVSQEEIIKALDTIDVCRLCQLRLADMSYDDHAVDDTPVEEGSHCCLCLGILEGSSLTSLAQKVAEILEVSNYDSPTFHVGFSLPHCVLLRQAAVKAHLVDNGLTMKTNCVSVKNMVRFFLLKLITKLSNKESDNRSQLFIKFDFKYAANMKEMSTLNHLLPRSGMKRDTKGNITNEYRAESVLGVVKGLSNSCVKKYMPCPPHALPKPCDCDISVCHEQICIAGRYNKYSRILSQTPWIVNGVRRGETSVHELISGPLKKFTRGDDVKFQSSGREDIDVQMLGNGRPFAIEVINPKRTAITEEEMEKLEAEINASTDMISVKDLQFATKEGLELMKKGEEQKQKTYRAKLWCPGKISEDKIESLNLMKDIVLKQRTPIRVLHRRALATRKREVHKIELKHADDEEHYELNVTTQAGTYIKELVHGDLGRTMPSLRTILGKPIDIVELDVMSIDLSWPPKVKRLKIE